MLLLVLVVPCMTWSFSCPLPPQLPLSEFLPLASFPVSLFFLNSSPHQQVPPHPPLPFIVLIHLHARRFQSLLIETHVLTWAFITRMLLFGMKARRALEGMEGDGASELRQILLDNYLQISSHRAGQSISKFQVVAESC